MKRFWFGAGLAICLLSSLWMLGIRQQLGVGTPGLRWVFDAYQHKVRAASQHAGPRLLVVAGSNAMFGIDSGQFEAFWGRPTVNLGVNAGLGLPYILDLSKRVARAGDVVLMPMEYALYLDDGSPNAQIIDYVIARDPVYWHRLSLWRQLDFAVGLTPERWLQGLQPRPDMPVTSGVYGAHHLDGRGDQTHSSAADMTPADQAAVQAASSWDYGARARKTRGGWPLMADYAAWARAQGVCVIAVPTVLRHHERYDTDPVERDFYASVPARIEAAGLAYVGQPRDFMYPASWFFNTDHHLQDWARKLHTAKLIQQLRQDPWSYCKKS
ncbi:MAG: hypothetical protein WA012_11835 [Rhodoferax sp.]|uniref:hypothetical protein n=1 Tax=Rhodoferax sp. TaxID=50421 RepID=UPI003BAE7561